MLIFGFFFSAVDVHVGKYILEECFLGYLSSKTRILVTHNLDYLKYFDEIYVMDKGEITIKGSFNDIQHELIFKVIVENSLKSKSQNEFFEEEKSADQVKKIAPKDFLPESNLKNLVINQVIDKNSELSIKSTSSLNQIDIPLMLAEDRETGLVSWKIYLAYFNYYGGFCFFLMIQISNFHCCNILRLLPLFSHDIMGNITNGIQFLVNILE